MGIIVDRQTRHFHCSRILPQFESCAILPIVDVAPRVPSSGCRSGISLARCHRVISRNPPAAVELETTIGVMLTRGRVLAVSVGGLAAGLGPHAFAQTLKKTAHMIV